ncbi:hypothetical protein, variant [Exophiala sideris]|uniref:Major facilitator superfamily (MFS) profile domain-containing protein n=1 Tax=Exophiala sideris TaxID=1016849 RepID=A0A0D1YT72_9EURO|nr:hypothetical protein PV11_00438 [Exophiala sideris]KIV84669.1 hypothetical protein, variant [Exophiala sideris]
MSEIEHEKMAATSAGHGAESPSPEIMTAESKPRGKAWMYKRLRLGPVSIPPFASPQFQIVFVALVCFLCPGMFNAVNGLGAAGQVNAHDINNANTAVYATFSVVAFFAGSIANKLGLRLTLGIGGFGYCLYIASLLSYNHDGNAGFLIFAGTLLGFCAGLLWTAQGSIMLSYPPEKSKGRYIAVFWMIFNLGAVIGGLVPLGQNINNKAAGTVGDGTYIAFIILMACGFVLAGFLCDPKLVERSDGSRVILMKNPTWKTEFLGLYESLTHDWYIIFLFPMFFASNWFYTYHFQDVNLPKFNVRTRALNSVLYYISQIIGAWIFGFALDTTYLRRTTKARMAMGLLFMFTMVIWGGGYDFQKQYTRATVKAADFETLDWTDSGYVGPMFLYMFYGAYDSVWQTTTYWLMGSMTNNGRKLANFAGFYKGIQSAGGAISPQLDSNLVSYMTEFAINWGLLSGSLLIAAPVIWLKVKDTTDLDEDLKFSDETRADVVPVSPVVGAEGLVSEKHH